MSLEASEMEEVCEPIGNEMYGVSFGFFSELIPVQKTFKYWMSGEYLRIVLIIYKYLLFRN
jgi:hypothetical protein